MTTPTAQKITQAINSSGVQIGNNVIGVIAGFMAKPQNQEITVKNATDCILTFLARHKISPQPTTAKEIFKTVAEIKLEKLLAGTTMEIPESNKELTDRNVRWILRNLSIKNGNHPDCWKAVALAKNIISGR